MELLQNTQEAKVIVFKPAPTGPGLPLAGFCVHAAFESPGTDYEEERVCLDDYVTKYRDATYYIRVKGDCMKNSGIHEDDLLVLNKKLKPMQGNVIIGVIENEFVIGTYVEDGHKTYLMPDNPDYAPRWLNEFTGFQFEGVITHTILDLRRQSLVRTYRLQQLLRKL